MRRIFAAAIALLCLEIVIFAPSMAQARTRHVTAPSPQSFNLACERDTRYCAGGQDVTGQVIVAPRAASLHRNADQVKIKRRSKADPMSSRSATGNCNHPTSDRSCLTAAAASLLARVEQGCGPQVVVKTMCPGCRMTYSPSHLSFHATGNAFDVNTKNKGCVVTVLRHIGAGGVLTYRNMPSVVHADLGPVMFKKLGGYEEGPFKGAADVKLANVAPTKSPTDQEITGNTSDGWFQRLDDELHGESDPLEQPQVPTIVFNVYSEYQPKGQRPVDGLLAKLRSVPVESPRAEIRRAASLFGVPLALMNSFAKIESDFNPRNRTGSYKGLFQLSDYEFRKYGGGDIFSARDNAIASANKFATESIMFEQLAKRKTTFSDLYLIHQQGWEGAAEHVAKPNRIAWRSMCATEDGRDKGPAWCRKAIWGNVPSDMKRRFGSVETLTSGAFVAMWRQRVDRFAVADGGTVLKPAPAKRYAHKHRRHVRIASR